MIPFTLDQLLALEAIARTGSFARAAEDLHKVPSAISYNIQGLEAALGVEIYDRSRRRAVLTDAGRKLLEVTEEVLEQSRRLTRVSAELRDGWEPELYVVVDGALPMAVITRCVRRFNEREVPTRLRVDVEYQEGVMDRLDSGPADFALTLGFDGDGDEIGYDETPLPDLDFVFVAAPDHPLAKGEVTTQRRADFAEIVVRDSSARFAVQYKGSFIGSKNVLYLSDFLSKRVALIEGAGYGWIPRHFVDEDLKSGALVILEAELNEWTYHPVVATRAGHNPGRAGALFLEILRSGDLWGPMD